MSTLFTDDFNRANGALGADWTSLGTAGTVNGNEYAGPASDALDYYDNGTPGAACWVEAVAVNIPAPANYGYVGLRLDTGTINFYGFGWDTGSASFKRYDGAVPTVIGATITEPTAGQTVRVEARGSTFSIYYDDVLQTTRTDATYSAAGRSGIGSLGTGTRLDDFSTGTLPTLSSNTPSGTIGTETTATIGATTDDTTGTFYVVVDTASLSGITATQIKAGQNAGGAAADFSGNSAVSDTSPDVGATGLTASTAYNYAVLQFSGGNSNILTGSFTTATPLYYATTAWLRA